jgi:glycosyltransferase involved in cell wall biosynthesis
VTATAGDGRAGAQLRVLFVCVADFRAPTEKQVLGFAQQLARSGHAVMISITGSVATAAEEGADRLPGLEVRRHRFRGQRLRRDDLAAARQFRPNVIHAANSRLPVIAAARSYAAATGAPVFVHFEDDEWGLPGRRPGEPWHRSLARLVLRPAGRWLPPVWPFSTKGSLDWVVSAARSLDALTPPLAEHVRERLGRECAVLLPALPEPPDAGAPHPIADGLAERLQGRRAVVYTGGVFGAHLADFRLCLGAVAKLQSRKPEVVFVHTGALAPRFDARKLVREAGIVDEGAIFLGYLPFAEVEAVLRLGDVCVQPGYPTEFNRLRLPSKLPRYLASGTPTVMYAAGPGELLEDRREVLKTYSGQPTELADRIEELLENPDLRRTLSLQGPRAGARLFDPVRNTEVLIDHYRSGIAGSLAPVTATRVSAGSAMSDTAREG